MEFVMNKKALLIILAALIRCEPCPAITSAEFDRLIPALIQVESGGNDRAEGDYRNGKAQAVGCLQIWTVMVDDVNRITGKAYTLKDRQNRQRSVEMARAYLMHYAKAGTIEQAARKWNGGPAGDKKAATVKYWEKVKKEMK